MMTVNTVSKISISCHLQDKLQNQLSYNITINSWHCGFFFVLFFFPQPIKGNVLTPNL